MRAIIGHAWAADKRRLCFGVLVSLLLGGFGWLVLRPHEPVYQGKPLSFWLEQQYRDGGYEFPAESVDATNAVSAAGIKAVPLFLKWVGTADSIARRGLNQLAREYPYLHLPSHEGKSEMAVLAFKVLGADAKAAVPALIRLLQDKDAGVRIGAARSLAALGAVAKEAVPALVGAVERSTGVGWQDVGLRETAAGALGEMGTEAEAALPRLEALTNVLPARLAAMKIRGNSLSPFFERLKDTSDPQQWIRAARLVGNLGPDGEAAIPLLIVPLTDTNPITRPQQLQMQQIALNALARIHRRLDLCLPVLVKGLDSPDVTARYNSLRALRAFGSDAKPAVPEIIRRLHTWTQWQWLQTEATNALVVIDPSALATLRASNTP